MRRLVLLVLLGLLARLLLARRPSDEMPERVVVVLEDGSQVSVDPDAAAGRRLAAVAEAVLGSGRP